MLLLSIVVSWAGHFWYGEAFDRLNSHLHITMVFSVVQLYHWLLDDSDLRGQDLLLELLLVSQSVARTHT